MSSYSGYELSLDEAIEHYGVKGMKWGVRRSQAALDRARKASPLVKTIAKTTLKASLAAGLATVGVPATMMVAANPELISAGKDWTKLALEDKGLIDMSAVDQAKAHANIQAITFRNRLESD